MKWQVWTYQWSRVTQSGGSVPIPDMLLFGGKTFPTKKEADSAWYDTCPGRNDHHVVLPVKS